MIEHLHILQHSLGLDQYGRGQWYRNHFVTGPDGTDFADCRALVACGLMTDHGPQELAGGMHCFSVTELGMTIVREFSPLPPKLTRSQRRYEEFLKADCGMKFGEWLRCRG